MNPSQTRASVLSIIGAHAVGDMWPPFKTKPFTPLLYLHESFMLGRCGENENSARTRYLRLVLTSDEARGVPRSGSPLQRYRTGG